MVMENWKIIANGELPPICTEVLGYAKEWIDEDYNPEGTRICFMEDDGYWITGVFCNVCDEYHTTMSGDLIGDGITPCSMDDDGNEVPPTHWIEKPKPPIS